MLGRVVRAAHRSSTSLARSRWTQTPLVVRRCYATPAAQPAAAQSQDTNPPATIDLLDHDTFAKHNLEKADANIPLLRVYEIVREAEDLINTYQDYDRAEAMLTGALDYIQRNKISDQWILAAAETNLGYALHQRLDYQGALKYYSIGIPKLAKEPVKDRRFLAIRTLSYAECFSIAGNHQAAESLCNMALQNLQKVVNQNDSLVGLTYSNLASYLVINGKVDKAVAPAEKAFDILSRVLGKHNEITKNCAINLSKIYAQLNRTDDIQALDERFMTDDEPILEPETGDYAPEYIETLKAKWRSQGPRKIFDPPGLHRSAQLSAKSYQAFIKSWSEKMPITHAGARVMNKEIKSLGYAYDKLPRYSPLKRLPASASDRPLKVKTGFEKLDIKGKTSLARLLDNQEKANKQKINTADLSMTEEDWRGFYTREREYQAQNGNPLLEGDLQEAEKSEQFWKNVTKEGVEGDENEGETPVEEANEIDSDDNTGWDPKKEFEYLAGHDVGKYWDKDTYNARGALHGTPEIQAHERSKSQANPEGVFVEQRDEVDGEDEDGPLDERYAEPTSPRFAPGVAEDYKPYKDHRVGSPTTTSGTDRFGTGPSRRSSPKKKTESQENQTTTDDVAAAPKEEGETEATEQSGKEGGRGRRGVQKSSKNEKEDPYAFNPEEDDVFPKETQKDRSHDVTKTKKEKKQKLRMASDYANSEPNYKHGRHEGDWHDDHEKIA